VTIAALPVAEPARGIAGPPQGRWTYDDILAIPDDGKRYEILVGVLYVSPPPSVGHPRRVFRLSRRAADFVEQPGLR
jgi:Uma2 family endonuclease